jgi:hypothetical protein
MHPCTAQNTHHVQSQLQATSPKKLSHPIMTPKEPIIIKKIVKKKIVHDAHLTKCSIPIVLPLLA